MKNLRLLIVVSPLLVILIACSSSSSSGGTQAVMAQTGYSTSSLSGTYSITWFNFANSQTNNVYYGAVGTIKLNGSGTITGGTITEYGGFATPCVNSVTGTYSLQSTALGTASLNLTSSVSGCHATDSWQLALAAADGGTAIQMARTDGPANGSAIKQ